MVSNPFFIWSFAPIITVFMPSVTEITYQFWSGVVSGYFINEQHSRPCTIRQYVKLIRTITFSVPSTTTDKGECEALDHIISTCSAIHCFVPMLAYLVLVLRGLETEYGFH